MDCFCGQNMNIAAIDIGQRFVCPTCQAQNFHRESFDVSPEELQGLNPIEYLARKQRVGEETVPLSPQKGDAGDTKEPQDQNANQGTDSHSNPSSASDPLANSGSGVAAKRSPSSKVSSQTESLFEAPKGSSVLPEAPTTSLPPKPSSDRMYSPTELEKMSDSSKIGLGILGESARLGKYQIRSMLGQGGMGIVYEAHDTDLDRTVALKVLNRDLCRNPRFIDRFKREAKAAAKLSHPTITHVYSIGEEDQNHFFAMEFVSGQNLSEILEEVGSLPPIKAIDIVRQTAVGLRIAIHSKIIHRDIKPSNLLLTNEGDVKITDFGLAKAVMGSAVELTTTGVVMGTPVYMSPEQGKGGNVDHRSDIYSLGATFYHLVVGQAPFAGDSPIAIILKHLNEALSYPDHCDVAEPIKRVIAHMMGKKPEDRYSNYDELIADLDNLIKGEEVSVQPESRETRVIVIKYSRPSSLGSSLFRVGKLSLAKTNLKLGRRDKAIAMLKEVAEGSDDRAMRAEAGLLLLDIYEKAKDLTNARRMAETITNCKVEGASTYALWKLARYQEEETLEQERQTLAHYKRLLSMARAEHRPVIEHHMARLKDRIFVTEQELAAYQVILVET